MGITLSLRQSSPDIEPLTTPVPPNEAALLAAQQDGAAVDDEAKRQAEESDGARAAREEAPSPVEAVPEEEAPGTARIPEELARTSLSASGAPDRSHDQPSSDNWDEAEEPERSKREVEASEAQRGGAVALSDPPPRSGGAWVLGLAAALLCGVGGAAWMGVFAAPAAEPNPPSALAPSAPQTSASEAATSPAAPSVAVPSEPGPTKPESTKSEPTKPESAKAASTDPTKTEPGASEAGLDVSQKASSPEAQDAAPEATPKPAAASPSSEALANPFIVPPTDPPTCQKLLGESPPQPGTDPVHEASLAWNEARKFIVGGKVDQAHQKMCEAVSLNSESAAVEGLAGLYLRLGAPEQALEWLDKAEELRPGRGEMRNLRGDIFSQMGKTEEARAIWLEMLAISPDETVRIAAVSKDYSAEASRHLRRGDYVRADQWYRRAATLDPKNLAAMIGLAKTFAKVGRSEHAKAFGLRSLAISDVVPEVHVLLGELALAEGQKEDAKKRFERALQVRPGFFPAKRGLAQVKAP